MPDSSIVFKTAAKKQWDHEQLILVFPAFLDGKSISLIHD